MKTLAYSKFSLSSCYGDDGDDNDYDDDDNDDNDDDDDVDELSCSQNGLNPTIQAGPNSCQRAAGHPDGRASRWVFLQIFI